MMRTSTPTPPGLAEWLLRIVLPNNVVGSTIAGDLREEFGRRAVRIPNTSRAWYVREAWSVVIHALKDRLTRRAEWGRAAAVAKGRSRLGSLISALVAYNRADIVAEGT